MRRGGAGRHLHVADLQHWIVAAGLQGHRQPGRHLDCAHDPPRSAAADVLRCWNTIEAATELYQLQAWVQSYGVQDAARGDAGSCVRTGGGADCGVNKNPVGGPHVRCTPRCDPRGRW